MSLDQFQILTKLGNFPQTDLTNIGDGSYSSVYRVKRLEDGIDYALKKVKIEKLSDREKENALNEVRILASIRTPSLQATSKLFSMSPAILYGTRITLFLSYVHGCSIVMEFADDGDVFQRICEC